MALWVPPLIEYWPQTGIQITFSFIIFGNKNWTKRQLSRILGTTQKKMDFLSSATHMKENASLARFPVRNINKSLARTPFYFTRIIKRDEMFSLNVSIKKNHINFTKWMVLTRSQRLALISPLNNLITNPQVQVKENQPV